MKLKKEKNAMLCSITYTFALVNFTKELNKIGTFLDFILKIVFLG